MDGQTVLSTGAAGRLGVMLRSRLARPGRVLRLLDVVPPAPASAGEAAEVLPAASVTDAAAVRRALDGADAVVHLGGIPVEDTWENILSVNIDGTRTVLEQARLAGVTRVVLASSNHAVGFVRRASWPDGELPAGVPPRPDTYYGVSKVAMEALGSLYHSRFGMDVICLRIGTCEYTPPDTRSLSTWLSADDMGRLAEAAISAPALVVTRRGRGDRLPPGRRRRDVRGPGPGNRRARHQRPDRRHVLQHPPRRTHVAERRFTTPMLRCTRHPDGYRSDEGLSSDSAKPGRLTVRRAAGLTSAGHRLRLRHDARQVSKHQPVNSPD